MFKVSKRSAIFAVMVFAAYGVCWAGLTIKPRISNVTGSGQVVSGAANVKSVTVYGPAAGDLIGIYNANFSTGPLTSSELELEIGISANTSTVHIPLGVDGVDFGAGVYVASSKATAITSVEYDY